MAAGFPEVGTVALCIAMGCAVILEPLLQALQGAPARSPVLDAAVAAVILTVPMAYLAGVILLHLHLTPTAVAAAMAGGAPVPPAALRQFLVLVCPLLLFTTFLFLAADGR